MPMYVYQANDGAVVERFYTMREPHPACLVIDGQCYRRQFSYENPAAAVQPPGEVTFPDGASRALPRRDPADGTPCVRGGKRCVEYADGALSTADGKPIIAGHRDWDRERSRAGHTIERVDPRDQSEDR